MTDRHNTDLISPGLIALWLAFNAEIKIAATPATMGVEKLVPSENLYPPFNEATLISIPGANISGFADPSYDGPLELNEVGTSPSLLAPTDITSGELLGEPN